MRPHKSIRGKLCIHELFEPQVERSPHAPAVVFRESAAKLPRTQWQGQQLARYLRELGTGPESLVGICVERSVEMVIGLLAILKAGGAICPHGPELSR